MRAEDESKFDALKAAKEGRPVLFTGEVCKIARLCIYPNGMRIGTHHKSNMIV